MKKMKLMVLICVCIGGLSNLAYAAESALLSALPTAVQEVVKREFPGATISSVDNGDYDEIPVYEVNGTSAAGVEFQLEIGKDGTLYQKDEKIGLDAIEPAVMATLKKEIGNSSPNKWKRMTEKGKVFYEIQAQGQSGEIELKIESNGKILEKDGNVAKIDAVASPAATPVVTGSPVPGSDELPIQFVGTEQVDQTAADGKLMYSPGVQNIQIARANRKHPPVFPEGTENEKGWTYQHHVGIGEWKGKLYGIWDMTHKGEDNPPVRLVYSTSDDGFNWAPPKDLYPYNKAYNSRFYFYKSTNDRMLVFASGWYETDNVAEDRKIRLYVREITADHKFGEIYTLIKPAPGHPPAYTESKDAGFLKACNEALNNNMLLEQADYGIYTGENKIKYHDGKNWPGGKVPAIGGDLWIFGKSMCFYHRKKDDVWVASAKMGWHTQSRDGGKTWSLPVIPKGIKGGGGKLWAQGTPDGRYAMVYIPQDDSRYPMAITSSDDGITFKDMRVIHGEVPPQRYEGRAKPLGPQYLRGVSPWGGDGSRKEKDCIWTIYSSGKEDIWVSRIPIPVVAEGKYANDNFDKIATGPRVPEWNIYSPTWAPVSIAADGSNHYLQLEDREPTDYARAIRTFPQSKTVTASFRVAAAQTDRGRLEIELLGELAKRPVRIVLNDYVTKAGEWLNFKINADCSTGKYTLALNGKEVLKDAAFAEPSSVVYALSFRTGEYRNNPGNRAKRDIPNTEEPLENVIYRIDDVVTAK